MFVFAVKKKNNKNKNREQITRSAGGCGAAVGGGGVDPCERKTRRSDLPLPRYIQRDNDRSGHRRCISRSSPPITCGHRRPVCRRRLRRAAAAVGKCADGRPRGEWWEALERRNPHSPAPDAHTEDVPYAGLVHGDVWRRFPTSRRCRRSFTISRSAPPVWGAFICGTFVVVVRTRSVGLSRATSSYRRFSHLVHVFWHYCFAVV